MNTTLIYSMLAGAGGGLVVFLIGLKHNKYRNNRYFAKLTIEIIGATVTATLLTVPVSTIEYRVIISFAVGIAWANIIQILRIKVTAIIEAAIGKVLQ